MFNDLFYLLHTSLIYRIIYTSSFDVISVDKKKVGGVLIPAFLPFRYV